jgi:two-component system, NtrC family, sensor kinase
MRLAAKLLLVLFAVVVLLTAVAGYFTVGRGFSRLEQQQVVHAEEMASQLRKHLQASGQTRVPDVVVRILQQNGSQWQQLRVRWVWLERGVPDPYRPLVPVERLARVWDGSIETITIRDSAGVRHLLTYCPIPLENGRLGGLELSESLRSLDEQVWATLIAGLGSIGAISIAGVLICWLVGVRWIGRPLDQLIAKTHRVGQGDFSQPLELRGHDELSELATALNEMCRQLDEQQQQIRNETAERLAAMEQLRHADRLKTVGRLAAGIAHELGTPLNVVSGRAGLIASGKLTDDEIRQSARTIKAEAERITGIIRQLLDFARRRSPHRNQIDLRDIARQTAQLLEPLALKRGIRLHVEDHGAPVTAHADFAQIQQVVTNLVMNAIQAMDNGGQVRVRMGRQARDDQPEGSPSRLAFLAVEDQGSGIAPEDLEHIFEPFFTTKQVGEGTGLGLSIAEGIVREHGGWMDVESQPGEGSRFTVFLPE